MRRFNASVAGLVFFLAVAAQAAPVVEPAYQFAVVMVNGTAIPVVEFAVDLDGERVTIKSVGSGMAATFPLERIKKIIRYEAVGADVPDDAHAVFINPSSIASVPDDGGIPVTFKVNAQTVSATGGSMVPRSSTSGSGAARSSGSTASSGGRTGSSAASSGRSYGQSSSKSFSSATSSRTSTTASRTNSSSSSSSADDFFNAIFGGRK